MGPEVGILDQPLPGRPETALTEVAGPGHPRVVSARRRRDEVRVWAADGGVLEVAVEVAEGARHRRLGRRLVGAARQLAGGEVVWAQVSAGNARSLRAFKAAGYRPVGSEALFLRP